MLYDMIVLDLDGTLTNEKKEITSFTKKTLMEYQQRGGRIVLASGRPSYGIEPIAEELELDRYGGYMMSYNGGEIIDCSTGVSIYQKNLPEEAIGPIYNLAKENKVSLLTYKDEYLVTETGADEYVQIESMINRMKIKEVPSFHEYIDFPVMKCLMMADGEYLEKVERKVKMKVGSDLNVFRSAPFFLEIVPQNIDKAMSLEKLLKHLEIDRSQVAAFGDGYNDKSMITYAGLGVAMENGQSEVKAVADMVAPSNEEDGVAQIVEAWFL